MTFHNEANQPLRLDEQEVERDTEADAMNIPQQNSQQNPVGPLGRPIYVHVNNQWVHTEFEIRLIYNESIATPSFRVPAAYTWNIDSIMAAVRQHVSQDAKALLAYRNKLPIFILQEMVLARDWMQIRLNQRSTFTNWFNRNANPSLGLQTVKVEVHLSRHERPQERAQILDGSGRSERPRRLDVYREYVLMEERVEKEVVVDELGDVHRAGDQGGDDDVDIEVDEWEEEERRNNEGMAMSTRDWMRS